jgi:hypothetical protein
VRIQIFQKRKFAPALDYIPASMRFLLQQLFVGKDISLQVAGIGQAVIQALCPMAIIAPLLLGHAVQMHYLCRSRFLINIFSIMWFSLSYQEVERFEVNAACSRAPEVSGNDIND